MLNKLNFGIVFLLILSSCNNEKNSAENKSSSETRSKEDTVSVQPEFNLNSNFKFTSEQKSILESLSPKSNSSNFDEDFKKYVDNYIQLGLNLDTSIQINTQYYREKLNDDNSEDVIITLNLLEFAKKKAAKAANPSQLAQIGFMGDYNYILFFDGLTCKIVNETLVRSTPLSPLKVNFENISSQKYKDVLIDFRILNASYKDFYTIKNNRLTRIFQWKNFDGLGKEKNEAYYFEFGTGTLSLAKDIIVYNAKFNNPVGEFDKFTFEPELIKTNNLFKRFFYHPETGIYMTR